MNDEAAADEFNLESFKQAHGAFDFYERSDRLYNMSKTENIARVVRADMAYAVRRELPRSWTKAAGMFLARKLKLEKHARNIRKEWSRGGSA